MPGDERFSAGAGLVIGGLAPILVAGLLVGVRGEILNANVALVLMVVVVLAATIGGRGAAVLAAGVATLSFDFFHTQPYNSLVIDSGDDLETAAFLLLGGLIVGQLATRARANRAAAQAGRSELHRIQRVADLVARGREPADVIAVAQIELAQLLTLRGCRFEAPPFEPALQRLERSGVIARPEHLIASMRMGRQGFELPAEGVELPVLSRGQQVGRFVLEPTAGVGASLEQRVVAVALADQVGAALGDDRSHLSPGQISQGQKGRS